jgi:hypothetical protein
VYRVATAGQAPALTLGCSLHKTRHNLASQAFCIGKNSLNLRAWQSKTTHADAPSAVAFPAALDLQNLCRVIVHSYCNCNGHL